MPLQKHLQNLFSYYFVFFTIFFFISFSNTKTFAQCDELIDSLLTKQANFIKTNNRTELAYNYIALAEAYLHLRGRESDQKAERYAEQALKISEGLENKLVYAQALVEYGIVKYDLEINLNETEKYFTQALKITEAHQEKDITAVAYRKIGIFYYKVRYLNRDLLAKTVDYLRKAFDIMKDKQKTNQKELAELAEDIAEVYYEMGDEKNAFEFAKKSSELEAQKTDFSKSVIIKQAFDKKQANDAWFWAIAVFLLIVFAMFIFVLFLWVAQSKQTNSALQEQKNRLNDQKTEIEAKNQEIEIKMQEIQFKNDEIQKANENLLTKNKEIDRQNREIILKQYELDDNNKQLLEKKLELELRNEEIETQKNALEVTSKQLEEQNKALEKSRQNIEVLTKIGQTITSSLDYNYIFSNLYTYIKQIMPADGFAITNYEAETNELVYKHREILGQNLPLSPIDLDQKESLAVWVMKNNRDCKINTAKDRALYVQNDDTWHDSFQSAIYLRLENDGKTIGTISIYSIEPYIYDYTHVEMLKTLSTYTSIALKNAETYKILNAAQNQLVESEKMAALGNLVAGVAHEINTPIGICVTASSRLDTKTKDFLQVMNAGTMKKKDLTDFLATNEEGMRILLTNLRRAADLVQGFKRVAVEHSSETQRVFDLKDYLQETIMSLKPEFKKRPFNVHLDLAEISINSYASAFSQIATNLFMNSIIHGFKNRETGNMELKTFVKGKNVVLSYKDDGNGMTPEILARIYEPFFTTNREGGGSGLGMNIVYNLVQKINGKIHVESSPGKGVLFLIEIPLGINF